MAFIKEHVNDSRLVICYFSMADHAHINTAINAMVTLLSGGMTASTGQEVAALKIHSTIPLHYKTSRK